MLWLGKNFQSFKYSKLVWAIEKEKYYRGAYMREINVLKIKGLMRGVNVSQIEIIWLYQENVNWPL